MKRITKISTLIIALTLAMSASAATKYCGEQMQSTFDNTTVSIGVTILKVENALRVTFDSDKIAGIRDGGNFRHWGNGIWSNQDDAVTNFEQGWTQNGTTWTKDFTFSTYPTSGTGEIYCLFDIVNAGAPPVAGFTLTEIDLFNVSCDGSGDSGDSGDSQDPDLPIPSTGPSNVNWGNYDWVPKNQCETCENQYKVETNSGCVIRAENIQDMHQNMSIYCVTAQVVTACNIGYTTSGGTGIWLHLSDLTSRETEVTLKFADGTTCSFWVLNDKAEPADDPSQPVGDGACIYEGIVGDGQTAGAGDLKIPFDEGYVVTLELNDDKTQLNIQLQLKEKDIENADRAYFLNYPEYDITKTINHHELNKSSTVPGLYTRSLPINQNYIGNYEKGIILFAIKVDYPDHPIKVTLPEYFRLDGSDCPPRVFTVYHHDDFPSTEEESEYTCTQFNGGVIYQPIQYKRRMPSEVWETLSVPFDVDSVTAFDPATGKHVRLYAQYNNGSTQAGNYWLRYFQTSLVTRDNFQSNWHDIDADNQDAAKPEKDKAYIIRLPNGGGYYNDKYIVFHGRGYQTIDDTYEAPDLPQDDYYSYSGNNTMMPQYLSSAYVLDNAGYYFTSSSTVTLPPFECSVNATAATIAKMPRIALNGRNNTTTDLTLLPTTDLQGGVIYSIFGAAVARFNTIDEYDQACQTLAAGVYVIVTPSTTTKIQIP